MLIFSDLKIKSVFGGMKMSNNLERNTEVYYLMYFKNKTWLLNVYIIKSDSNEYIKKSEIFSIIEKHLSLLEQNCISDEFCYFRTGFAIIHYGNRGVDLTIWHIGQWDKTYEIFSCSWYCYGRDTNNMELLNSAEPIICQYEIVLLSKEFASIANIIKSMNDFIDFRTKYYLCYKEN